MFFQKMLPLLAQCKSLTMTISMDGDNLRVVTLPVGNPGSFDGLRVPQLLCGTAAELDEGMPEFLASATLGIKSIQDQLAQNEASMQAEKARIANSAKTKAKPALTANKGAVVAQASSNSPDDDADAENENELKSDLHDGSTGNTSSLEQSPNASSAIPDNLFGDE